MDKNSITGIIIIVGMLLGYEYFFGSKIPAPEKKKAVVSQKHTSKLSKIDSIGEKSIDSMKIIAQDFIIENKDIKVTLSNIGGKIKEVQLKNYYTYHHLYGVILMVFFDLTIQYHHIFRKYVGSRQLELEPEPNHKAPTTNHRRRFQHHC